MDFGAHDRRGVILALHATAILGAVAVGATLWAWGQPLICTCGYVRLWVGSIFSSGNSQHVADWYTLSHITHGFLVVILGRLVAPRAGLAPLYLVAIATGVAWEIVEHTDLVLDRFRATTIYQGYIGDSVLNAVADYVFMLGGFFLAASIRIRWVILLATALEVTSATVARDSLLLTTIQVIRPSEAIDAWQQEINPNPRPAD